MQHDPAVLERLFTPLNNSALIVAQRNIVQRLKRLRSSLASLSRDKFTYSHYHPTGMADLSSQEAL